jgi:hypothetical protein
MKLKFKKLKSPLERLLYWMSLTDQQVIDKFAHLPGAIKVGSGLKQFVYIPGTRKDKVLLVSHADTVFNELPTTVVENNIIKSKNPKVGIGADDRAGIAILWEMKDSGHSILIPNGEERGGVGSNFLMQDKGWENEINSHQFAIEFDRCNSKDLVFYDVGSPNLLKYLKESYKGYEFQYGSYTDISDLCTNMAGVNVSVGYYRQHSSSETLVIPEWENTLQLTFELLKNSNIPRFNIESFPRQEYSKRYDRRSVIESDNDYCESYLVKRFIESKLHSCTSCDGVMTKAEILDNNRKCIYCKGYISWSH